MHQVLSQVQEVGGGASGAGSAPAAVHVGSSGPAAAVSADERHQMIAAAAYHRYEQRGRAAGDPMTDWLEAEREVDSLLGQQGTTLAERMAAGKTAFLRSLTARLAESQTQLEGLAVKAKAANSTVRRAYEAQRRVVAAKYEVARGKLVEIREHTDGAWGHLREGAEKAAGEMTVALRQLVSLLK